jgi:alkylhydroperoxidase family enzyme
LKTRRQRNPSAADAILVTIACVFGEDGRFSDRLSHFAQRFSGSNPLEDARNVIERLLPADAEVVDDLGRWYIRHSVPYRTEDDRISGVVVTFTEITERKRGEREVNEAKGFAEAIELAQAPQAFGEDDVQALLAAGFSREDVWDIGAITALFALSNRLAHLSGMRPNDEFFAMGREGG